MTLKMIFAYVSMAVCVGSVSSYDLLMELYEAMRCNDHEGISRLIAQADEHGCINNTVQGESPIFHAWRLSCYAVVSELLTYPSSDPNLCNSYGVSLLYLAAVEGQHKIVDALLEKKADPNVRTKHNGRSPLHASCRGNHHYISKALLRYGANYMLEDHKGKTPYDLLKQ